MKVERRGRTDGSAETTDRWKCNTQQDLIIHEYDSNSNKEDKFEMMEGEQYLYIHYCQ